MLRAIASIAAGLVALNPAPLRAQGESENVQVRNDCRLAAQIIRTGQPAPHRAWALSAITRCDESGATTLADVWRGALPTDNDSLGQLAAATRFFPKRVILEALTAVAESRARSTASRVHAISLIAGFARPGVYLDARDVFEPKPGRLPRIWTASGDQEWQDQGELADILPEARTLLTRVTSDSDPIVAHAAHSYLRILQP